MGMNALDISILVILVFCLIRGIFRGLVKENIKIIGVLGGFFAAFNYYTIAAGILSRWVSNPAYLNILGFLVLFFGVIIVVSILGVIIKYLLNISFLGWVDRICGAGFGTIKGILIVSILLIVFIAFLPKGSPVLKNSLLSPYVTLVSENMAKIVSKDMKNQFETKIKVLKKAWKSS